MNQVNQQQQQQQTHISIISVHSVDSTSFTPHQNSTLTTDRQMQYNEKIIIIIIITVHEI